MCAFNFKLTLLISSSTSFGDLLLNQQSDFVASEIFPFETRNRGDSGTKQMLARKKNGITRQIVARTFHVTTDPTT